MKPREQQFIKLEAPFIDEISELAIVKMLEKKAQKTMMLNLDFVPKIATLVVTNISLDMVIFNPKEMVGILDLRLLGYYKIK